MTETAQDAFKRLLRDVVAPALREQGLQGSGTVYVLPNRFYWAQVGFQKSTSSTRDTVKFTINLKVTDKERWNQERRDHSTLKDRPPPGVSQGDWDAQRLERSAYPARPSFANFGDGRSERIGHLVPENRDHWWTLTAQNADEVMQDALRSLMDYGLPWLRREVN